MTLREYIVECRRMLAICNEKCKAVDDFLAGNPDFEDEVAFKYFWNLEAEAAKAHAEYTTFAEVHRGQVTR